MPVTNSANPETLFRAAAARAAAGDPNVETFLIRIGVTESALGHVGHGTGLARNAQARGITQVERTLFDHMHQHPRAGAALRAANIRIWDDLRDPANAATFTRIALRTNPLPIPTSLEGQAAYWKVFWNTDSPTAKGTVAKFLQDNGQMNASALTGAMLRAREVARIYRKAKAAGLLMGGPQADQAKQTALAELAALPWTP